jgi:hypothetical protein
MRTAEARITLGVAAARQGDIERAVHYGQRALNGRRKSLPSLLMVSRDLVRMLRERYPDDPVAKSYVEQLHMLSSAAD